MAKKGDLSGFSVDYFISPLNGNPRYGGGGGRGGVGYSKNGFHCWLVTTSKNGFHCWLVTTDGLNSTAVHRRINPSVH